jgi:hypothetical protein
VIPYEVFARVVARLRDSEARADIGGVTAMITCDLHDALRRDNPEYDALEFWTAIENARRAYRARCCVLASDDGSMCIVHGRKAP